MLKTEINDSNPATNSPKSTPSPSNSSRSPSPTPTSAALPPSPEKPSVVISPCAACKIRRQRCAENCVLAPYFPPTEPAKFTIAHRVFGASNITKFLQELPEAQRIDAVSSIVYEAGARIRDPVYGCAGAIYQLQRQVSELQAQLAKAQAEVVNMQLQQANLLSLLRMGQQNLSHHRQQNCSLDSGDEFLSSPDEESNELGFLEDHNSLWDPLWT